MSDDISLSRRRSLALVVKLMFFLVILAFAWVIAASLTFNEQNTNQDSERVITIDVNNLDVGKFRIVTTFNKEIWIYRRSYNDIQQLKNSGSSFRSVSDEYFVFFPYEPVRNCQVQWNEHERTFLDPCSGNQFDLTGRIIKGQPKEQDFYLPVVDHSFVSPGQLKIDARLAGSLK